MSERDPTRDNRYLWLERMSRATNCVEYVIVDENDKAGPWRYVAVKRFMFTYAIIEGIVFEEDVMTNRWCYDTQARALEAMADWHTEDCTGEPKGWHRHPMSGRRVSQSHDEHDGQGRPVPGIGVMYIRH